MYKNRFYYLILLFLFVQIGSSFGKVFERSSKTNKAIPYSNTTVQTLFNPSVKKKKAKKIRAKKSKKKRYQLRHKPDSKHSPWPWIVSGVMIASLVVFIIGLILSIFYLWLVGLILLIAIPFVFFLYLIIALLTL